MADIELDNMFNRTTRRLEKQNIETYKYVFDIMTDFTSDHEHEVEKERWLIEKLIEQNDITIDLYVEKSFEYMVKNRGKFMTYNDNGIEISCDNSDFSIEEVFINVYKYLLFAQNYKERNKKTNFLIAVLPGSQDYTFRNFDAFVRTMFKFFEDADEDDCKNPSFYIESILSKYTPDIEQYNKLTLYMETLCDLFNQSRHYPEVFDEEIDGIISSMYSDKFIRDSFILRDFLETHTKNNGDVSRGRPFEI